MKGNNLSQDVSHLAQMFSQKCLKREMTLACDLIKYLYEIPFEFLMQNMRSNCNR